MAFLNANTVTALFSMAESRRRGIDMISATM